MGVYETWKDAFSALSFCDKIRAIKRINDVTIPGEVNHEVYMLGARGYLKEVDRFAANGGENEYYVYLWKHAWGDPFYVGSGKKHRWTSKNNRCDDFYLHLDRADAEVYLVLNGVDSKTARMFEKYVSVNLVEAGYTLANGDNNTEYMDEESRKRRIASCEGIEKHVLAPEVQKAVYNILHDNSSCDYRVTDRFITENGTDFFSRWWIYNRKERDSE